jgi:hypothetical protein
MAWSLRFRMQHPMVVCQTAWHHSAFAKHLPKASIRAHEIIVSCHLGTAAAASLKSHSNPVAT